MRFVSLSKNAQQILVHSSTCKVDFQAFHYLLGSAAQTFVEFIMEQFPIIWFFPDLSTFLIQVGSL